ncbi:like-Sm ribonucleo protein [Jaminaea rosea]|uniref:Sm protein G n=1 Tax=Jaminaea rosea TaxID=1569628 RepID=A0A316UNQ3_9BASI|nr:like-Sm ribonucleo protein [Jaminaea rosea]PWN24795.1 like-Sm ribonucleo protein [Jaminaea rosea]
MAKVAQPELKRYLNKRVCVNLQGGRRIVGLCSGFDIFMNMVIDEATEQIHPPVAGAQANADGRVQENRNVWQDGDRLGMVVVRGNSVSSVEGLEAIKTT